MPSHDRHWIRQLIWVYFFLLIFEGALRKWVVPGAANALLVVRDPVVLLAYFLALRAGLFPRNVFIAVAAVIGLASLTAGLLVTQESPGIGLYGFRTNFLQLPFIFLIAKVFDARDVERVGYWTMLLAMPMAFLMVLQFLAPPASFINSGSDDQFGQIASALGRIRPPGTFSFITGPVYFFALVVAFLLHSQFTKRYPFWMVAGATVATLCATAVSGSRSMLAALVVVFLSGWACSAVLRPALAVRWLAGVAVLGVVGLALSNLPFFKVGLLVFTTRVENASGIEGGSAGFLTRFASGFLGFWPALFEAPLLGRGLGVGTNVGLALLVDKSQFIWFEDEWARHIKESGPILGGAFVLYRIALTAWIGGVAVRHAVRRDPLPILIFGTCFLTLLVGIIGQATVLGFMILLSGLCLAATRTPVARALPIAPTTPAQNETVAA